MSRHADELRTVAFDLDHIRVLGGLGPRRVQSLRTAAAELRALADRREVGRQGAPSSRLPAVVSPS